MKTDYELLERLSELHARAEIAYRTDDLAFVMGQDTFHELTRADAHLRSTANTAESAERGYCGTLFGCPIIVTHGSGTLCLRREGIVGLLIDITEGINAEIERAARNDKDKED